MLMKLVRRAAAAGVLMMAVAGSSAIAQETFALSMGWADGESGAHLKKGFEDAVAEHGATLTIADANYDSKRQSDQIDAFIQSKPTALFITASDPAAIAPAVQRAIDAGIPVFASDSLIPGVAVTSTALSNNFGMGVYTGEYIAKRLGGEGNIGVVDLPSNETWDLRALGLKWALRQYPNIKIVNTWSFNPSGSTTPREGVEGILAANPDVKAIWAAWDGAAMEGALAIQAAGKTDVFTTGIDGGKQVFEHLNSETGVALSMAQSFYEMAALNVFYAYEHLAGNKVPRIAVTPTYAVTKDVLNGAVPDNYDVPGEAAKLGWERAL